MIKLTENHFHLKEEHIKLLRRSYITFNDHMYDGSAGVDMKRPYGNSDIYGDIAEILGWELFEDIHGDMILPKKQGEVAMKLHRETETALQIVLCTGSFQPGIYEKRPYEFRSWKLIQPIDQSEISNLEVARITLKKYFGSFHEIQSGEYVYLQLYEKGDTDGHLYVEGYEKVPLKDPGQLTNFMEFEGGKLVSY